MPVSPRLERSHPCFDQRSLSWGPLYAMRHPAGWWVTLGRWQLGWRDRFRDTDGSPGDPSKVDRPYFSERYQGAHGVPRMLVVRWGRHKVVLRRNRQAPSVCPRGLSLVADEPSTEGLTLPRVLP